ncbi:MAG: hypothetical protein AAFO91_00610 [Bacteroidota bacterium]
MDGTGSDAGRAMYTGDSDGCCSDTGSVIDMSDYHDICEETHDKIVNVTSFSQPLPKKEHHSIPSDLGDAPSMVQEAFHRMKDGQSTMHMTLYPLPCGDLKYFAFASQAICEKLVKEGYFELMQFVNHVQVVVRQWMANVNENDWDNALEKNIAMFSIYASALASCICLENEWISRDQHILTIHTLRSPEKFYEGILGPEDIVISPGCEDVYYLAQRMMEQGLQVVLAVVDMASEPLSKIKLVEALTKKLSLEEVIPDEKEREHVFSKGKHPSFVKIPQKQQG